MTTAQGFPAFPARPGRRARSWWAREFVAAMEDTTLGLVMLRRGRTFAGSGRVGPIAVSPGRIAAVVDDPDGAFDVVVRLAALDDAGWDRFLGQVAAESGHLAALLEGDVPRALVHSAEAADVSLLPTVGDLESGCGCDDVGDPCLHAAALCYQAAWLLDDDPFVLLLLRGRDRDDLLDALGARAAPAPAPPEHLPVPAAEAYAEAVPALPPSGPRHADARPIAVPPVPGPTPDPIPGLVHDAMARARRLLDP